MCLSESIKQQTIFLSLYDRTGHREHLTELTKNALQRIKKLNISCNVKVYCRVNDQLDGSVNNLVPASCLFSEWRSSVLRPASCNFSGVGEEGSRGVKRLTVNLFEQLARGKWH